MVIKCLWKMLEKSYAFIKLISYAKIQTRFWSLIFRGFMIIHFFLSNFFIVPGPNIHKIAAFFIYVFTSVNSFCSLISSVIFDESIWTFNLNMSQCSKLNYYTNIVNQFLSLTYLYQVYFNCFNYVSFFRCLNCFRTSRSIIKLLKIALVARKLFPKFWVKK